MDSQITIIVSIVAGLWAATNTGFAASKIINERRDIVVTGIYNGKK